MMPELSFYNTHASSTPAYIPAPSASSTPSKKGRTTKATPSSKVKNEVKDVNANAIFTDGGVLRATARTPMDRTFVSGLSMSSLMADASLCHDMVMVVSRELRALSLGLNDLPHSRASLVTIDNGGSDNVLPSEDKKATPATMQYCLLEEVGRSGHDGVLQSEMPRRLHATAANTFFWIKTLRLVLPLILGLHC
jgi:hypothetical protein